MKFISVFSFLCFSSSRTSLKEVDGAEWLSQWAETLRIYNVQPIEQKIYMRDEEY